MVQSGRALRLADADAVASLASRLSESLPKSPTGTADEASWELAHAFADMEASFVRFLDGQMPRMLEQATRGQDLYDVLLDIGEELRQVMYNVRHVPFYAYLGEAPEPEAGGRRPRPRH